MVLLLGLVRAFGRTLLAGTLPLRCCFVRFACRTPTWRLPSFGGVGDLVTANLADRREVVPAAASREVFGVRCEENEFDSTEKTPHTLQGLVFNLGHVGGKDCDFWTSLGVLFLLT